MRNRDETASSSFGKSINGFPTGPKDFPLSPINIQKAIFTARPFINKGSSPTNKLNLADTM